MTGDKRPEVGLSKVELGVFGITRDANASHFRLMFVFGQIIPTYTPTHQTLFPSSRLESTLHRRKPTIALECYLRSI